ncbi:MAG: serine/threonine-protein kinase [Planctomycetota bacterium]
MKVSCLSKEEWLHFILEEDHDSKRARQLDKHLSECSDCQNIMRVLDESPEFDEHLRQKKLSSSCMEPSRDTPGTADTLRETDDWQSLIVPPDDPRFAVTKEIGRGSNGVVYKAVEISLKRVVAIKVLHPSADLREAETMARVTNPHLVAIYTVQHATSPETSPYLVMEHLGGGSLKDWLRDPDARKAGFKQIARIVKSAAIGLSALHAHDIVHRDVKPSNLMLDSSGALKVADLGLAKRTVEISGSKSFVGTYAYASPEQLRGDNVDCSSDLFSLGLVFYELVTGERPTSQDAILNPRLVAPTVPFALQRLMMGCLRADPKERLTATELHEDLDRYLEGKSLVTLGRSTWIQTAITQYRFHVVTALLLLLLIGSLLSQLNFARREIDRRHFQTILQIAENQSAVIFENEVLLKRVENLPLLETLLSQSISDLQGPLDENLGDLELLIEATDRINDLAVVWSQIGEDGQALSVYEKELAVLSRLIEKHPSNRDIADIELKCRINYGLLLSKQASAKKKGIEVLTDALAASRRQLQATPEDHRFLDAEALCLNHLGIQYQTHSVSKAAKMYAAGIETRRALAKSAKVGNDSENLFELATLLVNYGTLWQSFTTDRGLDPEDALKEGTDILRALGTSTSPVEYRAAFAKALNEMGNLEHRKHVRLRSAGEYYRRSISVWEALSDVAKNIPRFSVGLAMAQSNLGNIHWDAGEISEACELYLVAESRLESVRHEMNGRIEFLDLLAGARINAACALQKENKLAVAMSKLEDAISILTELCALPQSSIGSRATLEYAIGLKKEWQAARRPSIGA